MPRRLSPGQQVLAVLALVAVTVLIIWALPGETTHRSARPAGPRLSSDDYDLVTRDYESWEQGLLGYRDSVGKPDLATANSDGGTVSVLANRGDGTFAARRNYEAGESPEKVASGDLNGDRKPDLAITNGVADSGTLSVLLNTTGLCTVPNLRGKTLPAARRAIARGLCRVGTIRRAYSKIIRPGRVISQKPRTGTVLRRGGKINLVVSGGRKG